MKKKATAAAAAMALLAWSAAHGETPAQPVRIGVIADMTGVYSALGGRGMATAVKMAVKDFGGKVLDRPIEILTADSQNKVDVTATRAREWYDREQVGMILEGTDSASAIALQRLGLERKKVTIFVQAATSALTESECSPYGIHYVYNTQALANTVGRAIVDGGGSSWYFITADYAFGQALESDTSAVVKKMGGVTLGSSRHPIGAPDFSSFVVAAQSSKASVIGLANAGKDTQNAIRQAAEFGLGRGKQVIAPLLIFETDIRGIGLNLAQGLQFATAFYWDANEATRAFSKRFFEAHQAMPTMVQAGAYSATMHYLKAIKEAGTADSDKVVEKMKAMPVNDFFASNGTIQKNGLMVHDLYLAQVKTPGESRNGWDLLKITRTIPGASAFRPQAESTCRFLKG
ncbi:ABC transporter substrate-binding protein [Cupriavidus sp. 2TAF22]|uniref:ABC transporter substrate-binding protein n=1 Tax=unclassified Cupriavidus TaxID=2640874 RepID=UPI003F90CA89